MRSFSEAHDALGVRDCVLAGDLVPCRVVSTPKKRTVAFFGGSFNPPHVAHVLAAVYAKLIEPLDGVLVVPVFRHPFPKTLAPFADRLRMCELAFADIPHVAVSRVEETLGGESRTLRTIEYLVEQHPDWQLRLLIGADILPEIAKWHRFDRIEQLAPPLVLLRRGAMGRAGMPEGNEMLPKISSTEIRHAIRRGDRETVRPALPRAVLEYIERQQLYRDSA